MKTVKWIGSSKKDLMAFPDDVIQEMGYALHLAQKGELYNKAKPFKGCGSGVYEIALAYDKNAYRAIYTVSLGETLYVVHCFQKKSKQGIKTPKEEVAILQQRLKWLRAEIGS